MLARAEPFRPARADWLQAGIVAAALFALYAASSPRTVAAEDDGLFVLSSYFLGIEHPPGYPLHTLLGKLFTLLPFGSVAYRVHLLSALAGALTGGAVWMCARALIEGRIPAYLAVFGLGLSRTFWSQAIIAEVYTLNTFFLFVLVWMGLRACPREGPASGRLALPAMAFVFGLSLANHWPLMLLVAPAFAILLWPRAREALKQAPVLAVLFVLGLTPYAWMVLLSWAGLPISFYGPIESFREFWFVVSRAGYAEVDVSYSATWIDRIKFLGFMGSELVVQFALAGTLVAGAGYAVQWQAWGRRLSWFFTLGFLGPSVVLLLLLGFDYDSKHKHMFLVYLLPAYGIAALWMALGFAWLARRVALRPAVGGAACAALLGPIFVVGCQSNLRAGYDWTARYADAVLRSLPEGAVLFARSELDLAPIAYFHMVEGRRPDITIYQVQGLTLGNRLFHPLRTSEETARVRIRAQIDRESGPVVFTQGFPPGYARRDHWLYVAVDRSSGDPDRVTIDVPEDLVRFFEDSLIAEPETNAWAAFVQGELRRNYGRLLAESLPRAQRPDPRAGRHLEALSRDFFGALGVVEGLLANKQGYSAEQAVRFLDNAWQLMPPDAAKNHRARFFELRGYLRLGQGDERGAVDDLETAISIWPLKSNGAVSALTDLYTKAGDENAVKAMQARLKH